MAEITEKRLKRGSYTLDADFFKGFKTAVRNSQTMLALEYLLELVTDLKDEIEELKTVKPTSTAKSSTKKVSEESIIAE